MGLSPELSIDELMRQLTPPPEFASARFENYRPDPNFTSQQAALDQAKQFVTRDRKVFGKVLALRVFTSMADLVLEKPTC